LRRRAGTLKGHLDGLGGQIANLGRTEIPPFFSGPTDLRGPGVCVGRTHGAGRRPRALARVPESGRKSRSQRCSFADPRRARVGCLMVTPLLGLESRMAFSTYADACDSAFSVDPRRGPGFFESAAHGKVDRVQLPARKNSVCRGMRPGAASFALGLRAFDSETGATRIRHPHLLCLPSLGQWTIWGTDCRRQRWIAQITCCVRGRFSFPLCVATGQPPRFDRGQKRPAAPWTEW
jgi:hypothetical protein